MPKKSRFAIVLGAVVIVVVALVLYFVRSQPTVVRIDVLPDSPVYFVSARGHDGAYFASTHAKLCEASRDVFTPIIASEVQWDRAGRLVTMRLDPEAQYADGMPILAADVVATVRTIKGAHTRSGPYKAKYHNVIDITASGPREVRWQFYELTGRELADACDLLVLPATYLERAAAHVQAPWSEAAPGLPPATGRMQPRGTWSSGSLELIENAHAPVATRRELDSSRSVVALPAQPQAARLLVWNGKSRWGAEADVRRAVSHVVRREPWQTGSDGMKPAHSLFPHAAIPGGDLISQARESLVTAGWRKQADTGRWIREGDETLRLRVLVSTELSQTAPGAIDALKHDLSDFGIDVTVDVLPWMDWSAAVSKGAYDAYVATLHLQGDPAMAVRDFLPTAQGVRSVLNTHVNLDSELTNLLHTMSESELQDPTKNAVTNADHRVILEQKLQAWAPLTVLARNY